MKSHLRPLLGVMLSCPMLLLTACATKPVATKIVTVDRLVYVPLDARLTDPVNYLALGPGPVTNGALAESYDSCRAAVKTANGKLGQIAGLQKR